MRFLVDECLSTRIPMLLAAAGHDAPHVVACGLAGEPDERVLVRALDDDRVLLSADTDFGEILARSGSPAPSVILFRREDHSATSTCGTGSRNLESPRRSTRGMMVHRARSGLTAHSLMLGPRRRSPNVITGL